MSHPASRVTNEPWLAPEAPDLVWFSGTDAVRFLDDLISQRIDDIKPGETRRSFLLDPTGRLSHLLWVVKEEDRVGLITDPGRGEDLKQSLARFRIRVDVDIEVEHDDIWLVMGDWDGIDVSWGSVSRALVIGEQPKLREGTRDEFEAARVAAGEPAWGHELDEKTMPHETGLVSLAVDFDKGCFLGQELVARVDSRGGTSPRRLRRIALEGSAQRGAPIIFEGESVGSLTSVSERSALALVHRNAPSGAVVEVGDTSGVIEEITRIPPV